MAKASPIVTAFNSGEFSPELDGRVDIGKYSAACSRMENFVPLVQGPARRRGGTQYVAEVKDSSDRTWLATFQFSTEQAYVLEFGDSYLRFFTDNGILTPGTPTAYSGGTAYVPGDLASSGGVNYYCISNTTGNAPPNVTYWYAMPTGILEIPTPWATAALINDDGTFALQMVQSGDILYICHPDYAPRKLSRLSATGWTITTLTPEGGPFDDYDPDETITVYASAQTGSVTLQASSDIFASTDVGRLFYLEQKKVSAIRRWEVEKNATIGDLCRYGGRTYKALNSQVTGTVPPTHVRGAEYDGFQTDSIGVQWQFEDPGYGWCEITGFTDANTVTATVLSQIPEQCTLVGNATTRWTFGSWGSVPGYPSHVCFFRNRLVFLRASDRKVWCSVAADYEVFTDRDEGGEVTAEMAITLTVEADQSANMIQWVSAGNRLLIGTAGSEYIISEMTDSDPFGPANAKVVAAKSAVGSRGSAPVRVGGDTLFVQRSGRKLRAITYDGLNDSFDSLDMSILATHLVPKDHTLVQLAYQKEPHSIVWAARSDGLLLGFTFSREQYTEPPFGGWHRHPLGGDGIVESLVCVPSPDNGRDDLWMIVRRTIDGSTQRYIEFMRAEYESGDDQEDAFYVDCGLTYSGGPVDTISGLGHLEGETVDVLADGAVHPQCVVDSGAITLDYEASVVQVGLPCPAKLATVRMNAGAADGTAQGKTKRTNLMVVRLMDTLGGRIGPTEDVTDEILFRRPADSMSAAVPIFTGDKEITWPGDYEKDGIVWYVNDQPLPATVVAFMPQVTTQDR